MYADDATDGLWFSIEIEEEEFLAFISSAALHKHFNAPEKAEKVLLRTYLTHQEVIHETARRKFLNGSARPVKLCVHDFKT